MPYVSTKIEDSILSTAPIILVDELERKKWEKASPAVRRKAIQLARMASFQALMQRMIELEQRVSQLEESK